MMVADVLELETPERVLGWAQQTLQPAVARYTNLGDTALSLPAVRPVAERPLARVIPTEVLIRDAVECYTALHGHPPKAVVLHPLRLLSVASKSYDLYFVGAVIVKLRTRSGLLVDEAYGADHRATQPVATIEMESC
jgi:hypothetical protein